MRVRLAPGVVNKTVAVCAVLISVGWMIGAAYLGIPDTGGRGGAIVVAISFFILFVGGDIGSAVYGILTENTDSIDKKVDAIVSRLNTDSAAARRQNKYLAFSSVTGTIAWGFGDLGAKCVTYIAKCMAHVVQAICG